MNWRGVVLIASAVALFAVPLISFVALPPEMLGAARFDVRAVPRILGNANVVLADTGYWGHMWELYAVWAWGPVFYAASLHAANVRAPAGAIVFAAFGVAGAAGCCIAGILGDRFGRARTAGTALAISGAVSFSIGYAFGGNVWLLTILFFVWGLTVVADSAQFSAAVTQLADRRYVGTALMLQMGIGFLITMYTIWLVGYVEATAGWRSAFMLLSAGPVLGVLAMIVLHRRCKV